MEAWTRPTFRIRDKKMFAMFMDNHHDDGRLALWVNAPPGDQHVLIDNDPDRFFVPPYMGPSGWVGVRLEGKPDWDEVADLIEESYRMAAPKKLLELLDER
jgi:predicted DNA-binding protein (MmcQ/YjbR family)